jgi:hypothetical protein
MLVFIGQYFSVWSDWRLSGITARQAGTGQTRDVVVREDTNVTGTGQPAMRSSAATPGLSQLEYLIAAISGVIPSSLKQDIVYQ